MTDISITLTRRSQRSGKIIWMIAVFLCLVSFVTVMFRGFNTNLLNLIPEDAHKTHLYLKLIQDFGIMEETYVILDGDIRGQSNKIEEFVRTMEKSDLVNTIRYKLDPAVMNFMRSLILKNVLLYLNDEEIDRALTITGTNAIKKRINKIRSRLILPSKTFSMSDPLGFSESIVSRMPSLDMPFDKASGLFLSEDGQRLFIILDPAGEARDIDYDRNLMALINESFNSTFKEDDQIRMGITGSHPITYYEQKIMKADMEMSIVTAFLAVALIFIIFLRTIRGMLYAFIPVLFAVFITTGIAAQIFGSMSEISGAFGAMLVGLGVDLSIVLYMRNIILRDIELSVKETSSAIWTGVLTTAATFLPMMLSDFRGIRELGLMTSIGIILCAVFIFSLSAPIMSGGKYVRPRPTFVEHLSRLALLHRKSVIVLLLVVVLVALYAARDVTFSADLRTLGAKDNRARDLLNSIGIERGSTFISGLAPSLNGVIRNSSDISERLYRSGVNRLLSIASFVPDIEQQKRNLEKMRSVDVDDVIKTFSTEANRAGFSGDHIREMSKKIREYFFVSKPVTLDDFIGTGMESFLARFYKEEDGMFRYIVMVNEEADVSGLMNGYDVTGPEITRLELSSKLRNSAGMITIIGILLVNIILYVKFRNVLHVIYAQVPVVLSLVLTGAVMKWLGVQIHVMNAVVVVMLFGIGTDYSIHLIHHIVQEKDLEAIMHGTGRAVTVAALTTIAGFGSLYFSSYRGLSEMGLAVTIGCVLTLIFSLTLIPIFMSRYIMMDKMH
jgi:predicted RND superfamily exporter protein